MRVPPQLPDRQYEHSTDPVAIFPVFQSSKNVNPKRSSARTLTVQYSWFALLGHPGRLMHSARIETFALVVAAIVRIRTSPYETERGACSVALAHEGSDESWSLVAATRAAIAVVVSFSVNVRAPTSPNPNMLIANGHIILIENNNFIFMANQQ